MGLIVNKYIIDMLDLDKYDLPTLIVDDCYLFDKSDALVFVNICEENRIIISGIEGFIVSKGFVVPVVDCICDFSNIIKSNFDIFERTIEYSRVFISEYGENCGFMEFVLHGIDM